MDGYIISLIIIVVLMIISVVCIILSTTSYFKNLAFKYNLPVVGTIPNIQESTVPKMRVIEQFSSEEVSSDDIYSSDDIPGSEELDYSEEDKLTNLYKYERKNMNPYGNYRLISAFKKENSKKIDDLLSKLYKASESGNI